MPFGPRKSGMPALVEIPAPVWMTMDCRAKEPQDQPGGAICQDTMVAARAVVHALTPERWAKGI